MRIIHVVWCLTFGGAETLLIQLLNLQCVSNDVSLVVVNDVVEASMLEQIDKRVRIITINRPLKSKNPFYILKLSWKLLFSKSDIIHFHQDNLIEYIPIRFFKKNFCLTVHSVAIEEKSLNKYNHLFAISQSVQKQIKDCCNLDSTLVYNGINISEFKIRDSVKRDKKYRIVQLGRLDHVIKGQDLLIRAVSLLAKKGHTDLIVSIIGDGPSFNYLQTLIYDLELAAYVKLEGSKSIKEICENLCHYDLLVQPSRYEGFGLVAIEAMIAKVPALTSNVDGLREIIQQDKYGFTFATDDEKDLANKIEQILNYPEEQMRSLVNRAHQYVVEHFDVSVTSERYLEAYKKIALKK